MSDLITSLARDQATELAISVTGVTPVKAESTQQFNSASEIPDVSAAVSNILNDLSSGDDSLMDAAGDTAS